MFETHFDEYVYSPRSFRFTQIGLSKILAILSVTKRSLEHSLSELKIEFEEDRGSNRVYKAVKASQIRAVEARSKIATGVSGRHYHLGGYTKTD